MKKFFAAAIIMVAFFVSNNGVYAQSSTPNGTKIELVKNSKATGTSPLKIAPSESNGDKKSGFTVDMDGQELTVWINKNGTPFLWRQGKNGGYRYYFKGEQKEQVYKALGIL